MTNPVSLVGVVGTDFKREHIIDRRVLEQDEIRQLVELGSGLVKHFGAPQEIIGALTPPDKVVPTSEKNRQRMNEIMRRTNGIKKGLNHAAV